MEFTEEQIKGFKEKHGTIFKYTAEDGKSCILKAPSLQALDACRTISGNSSIQFDDALLQNAWVSGDEEIRTVDKYKMGIFDHLGKIMIIVHGQLEEL